MMRIATYRDFFRLIGLENYDFTLVIVLIYFFVLVTLIFNIIGVFHGSQLNITTQNFLWSLVPTRI